MKNRFPSSEKSANAWKPIADTWDKQVSSYGGHKPSWNVPKLNPQQWNSFFQKRDALFEN